MNAIQIQKIRAGRYAVRGPVSQPLATIEQLAWNAWRLVWAGGGESYHERLCEARTEAYASAVLGMPGDDLVTDPAA